jgi:hypothetical protein
MTMKLPLKSILLLTGGLSKSRLSAIHFCKLKGMSIDMGTSLVDAVGQDSDPVHAIVISDAVANDYDTR